MVMNDSGVRVARSSNAMSASLTPNAAAAAPANSSAAGATAAKAADDAASSITVNTNKPATTFPPPKTDKPRPHVCSTCQRSFARLEHLKRHERSHTKEKPFECPECARCFARRDLLLRHQQKLHQTSTPSSRPRNRRESTSGTPAQSRARKNSVAGANAAAAANANQSSMRPRANTISHVDANAAVQMMAAVNAAANQRIPQAHHGHSRHPSLIGLPLHGFDHTYGGMAAAMGQRGMPHGLPKLETATSDLTGDFSNGLRTAPPMALGTDFDFESLFFGGQVNNTTINPNALHYSDSPPSMALDPTSPFGPPSMDVPSNQPFDDNFEWLTGFDNQMSFAENVVDESSPSALSTTSQSGISDVMVDGSNHKAPAGTSATWQPAVMGPPQMNPFAMDLNGSVFPDLLNGAPMSPQPASQKINDPYFSAPPTSLSTLSPSAGPGLNPQTLNHTLGFNAAPDSLSSLGSGNNGGSPVTTITESTRAALVKALSQCLPFGGRKYSQPQLSPQSPGLQSASGTSQDQVLNLPSTQDLKRYVGAYISYMHPHLPFLHLPTLSFDIQSSHHGYTQEVDGSGCLLLSMATIGALYEMDRAQSMELFEMAKKLIFSYLEERRKADVRKADHRRGGFGESDFGSESTAHTPVWLVQAMLLNVTYGHNCGDKTASDIASTHCTALVSLAQAAGLLNPPSDDIPMSDGGNWAMSQDQQEHIQWLQWKSAEERKRTLYSVFHISSVLVSAYNHAPALPNSEVLLYLPCDEEFYSAGTAKAFIATGGVAAANRSRITFHDALGELLRTNERQQQQHMSMSAGHMQGMRSLADINQLPPATIKPSTFGCLILINALHNYIWETRQRHHNKVWTNEETEKMHRHIEPALRAWQAAWASNPHHSLERPNPYGLGPLSADALPLLDLAYIRLFVNLARPKEKFWQRDWEGMAEEMARSDELVQNAEHSPMSTSGSMGTDKSDNSVHGSAFDSPATQPSSTDVPTNKAPGAFDNRVISRREKHLRKVASYAADSLAMSDKLGVTFADFDSRELPLQSALCTFDCAQVLAEWVATLQDRVGRYVGIIGHDPIDFTQMPAIMVLEEEEVKLIERIREILSSAEMKINMELVGNGMGGGVDSRMSVDGHNGFAAKILRITAYMLERSAVWPVMHLVSVCMESQAVHARARAEKSTSRTE